MAMKEKTLCFLVTPTTVWLAMKMVRFGVGKWNGYGGSRKGNETIREAAVREIWEESGGEDNPDIGVRVIATSLEKVAIIEFFFGQTPKQRVHVFLARKWQGTPASSQEMASPTEFLRDQIPYDGGQMWAGDKLWMPLVLEQGKRITGTVRFNEDGTVVEHFEHQEHDALPE